MNGLNLAQWLFTVGKLLELKVPIFHALSVASTVRECWGFTQGVIAGVGEGETIARTMRDVASKLQINLPQFVVQLVDRGETYGQVPQACLSAASIIANESSRMDQAQLLDDPLPPMEPGDGENYLHQSIYRFLGCNDEWIRIFTLFLFYLEEECPWGMALMWAGHRSEYDLSDFQDLSDFSASSSLKNRGPGPLVHPYFLAWLDAAENAGNVPGFLKALFPDHVVGPMLSQGLPTDLIYSLYCLHKAGIPIRECLQIMHVDYPNDGFNRVNAYMINSDCELSAALDPGGSGPECPLRNLDLSLFVHAGEYTNTLSKVLRLFSINHGWRQT